MNDTQQYAWRVNPLPGQDHVINGETVISFRGESFTFEGVSRGAYGNSSGRVAVSRLCADAYDNGHGGHDCVHMWHREGIERDDFFPSVFDLYLGDENGVEAR